MGVLRTLLVFGALLSWPATASASSVVLLPEIGGDHAVSAEARMAARVIAREVLEGEGWTVFEADTVVAALPPGLASCGPDDRCAFELRALLGADAAVGLSLHGEGENVLRVVVVITSSRGVAHRADARVDPEAGLPFAVAEPLREALRTWVVGRPGERPAGVPIAAPYEPALGVERSFVNWFLGGFLVLGSAPLLGYGINTAARDGECVAEGLGGCTQRIRFEEGAAIFTGLGAALLAAGVVLLVTRPIPVFVQAGSDSASLRVRGTF